MKIRKVIASDFGCLSGSYSFSDERMNIVVEPNERGKSTLVAAILAGLYGFPPKRERLKLPEEEAYSPWKGGAYRVLLEVVDDEGRPLTVERDFGEGTVRIMDVSTNKDITQEFRAGKSDFAIGDRLLGISRDVFIRTCLVRQLEIERVGGTSQLVSKVQQIFDTSSGKGTAAEAIGVLEKSVRKYAGTQLRVAGRVEEEIKRLNEEIGKRQTRMRSLAQVRAEAAPSMSHLRELRLRYEKLGQRRQQLEYLTRKAELGEIETALKQDAKNRAELAALERRLEFLKPYRDFRKEKASDFSRLAGQREELHKRRTELADSLGKLKPELQTMKSKLQQFRDFDGIHEDVKTRLHDLSRELSTISEEARAKSRLLSEFEESLQKEGYDLSELDDLHRRFSELRVEDKDMLRDSEAGMPHIDAEVAKLEGLEERLRTVGNRTKWLLAVVGLVWLAAHLALALGAVVEVYAAILAAGTVGLAVALYFQRRAFRRLEARSLKDLRRKAEKAGTQREALIMERTSLSRKLEEMASKTGYQTDSELAQAFKRWGRLQDRTERLRLMREGAKSVQEKLSSRKEAACSQLRKVGVQVSLQEINPAVVKNAEDKMSEYLNLISSQKQIEERYKTMQDDLKRLDGQGKTLEKSIREILSATKLPLDLPIKEARLKVDEAREKSDEFHRLAAVQIPEKRKSLFPPEKFNSMGRRLESLLDEIRKMAAEAPALADHEPTQPHTQYAEEAREVAKEVAENTEERAKIARLVESVEEKYRDEYPRLANELEDLKETLDRTERFQKAVSIAIKTLQEISARSHAQWAAALNPRTNEILRHLNPKCRELKFDRNLSFTVIPAEGANPIDRKMIEAQQSVGARHQIYLAVRLALTDYLSAAGKALPVILDDPFATSDDDRFLSGMSFLCRKFQKKHQLIILTCHRQRHTELLKQKSPGLTDEILLIDLSPAR